MNNLTLGGAGLHLLRDPGRRPGRLARRRRPVGRARGDEQHAQHAGRGARDGLSAARRGLPAAARDGRRRAPTAAATASSGGCALLADAEASVIAERRAARPVGPGRRRRRRPGPDHPQRRAAAGQVARPAPPAGTSSGSRRRAGAATAPRRLPDVLGHLDDDVDPGDLLAGRRRSPTSCDHAESAPAPGRCSCSEDREEPTRCRRGTSRLNAPGPAASASSATAGDPAHALGVGRHRTRGPPASSSQAAPSR